MREKGAGGLFAKASWKGSNCLYFERREGGYSADICHVPREETLSREFQKEDVEEQPEG